MIRIRIDVNLHPILKYVHAIRIDPTNCGRPDDCTLCTYKVMYGNDEVGLVTHPYGDALGLTIVMLEKVKEKISNV